MVEEPDFLVLRPPSLKQRGQTTARHGTSGLHAPGPERWAHVAMCQHLTAACRSCRTGTRSRYRFVDTEVWGCATKPQVQVNSQWIHSEFLPNYGWRMLEMVLCQNGVGLEFGSSYSYSIRFLPSISVRLCLFPSFYFIQSSYKYTSGMKGQTFLQGSTSPAAFGPLGLNCTGAPVQEDCNWCMWCEVPSLCPEFSWCLITEREREKRERERKCEPTMSRLVILPCLGHVLMFQNQSFATN